MSTSLDGFTGLADGTMDWLEPEGEPDHGTTRHQANLEMLSQTGAIVMRRVAYATMCKVLFSETLDTVDWENVAAQRGTLAEEIGRQKSEPSGDIRSRSAPASR